MILVSARNSRASCMPTSGYRLHTNIIIALKHNMVTYQKNICFPHEYSMASSLKNVFSNKHNIVEKFASNPYSILENIKSN